MKEGIGAKGGRRDLKLTLSNRLRNKKRLEKEKQELKIKEEKELLNKKKIEITKQEDIIEQREIDIKPGKKVGNPKQKEVTLEKQPTSTTQPKEKDTTIIRKIKPSKRKDEEIINTSDNKDKDKNKKQETIKQPKGKNISYLEKEIIHILEDTIKENNYSLKKIDSDIYTLKQTIDHVEEENLDELEKEIDDIISRFNIIQEQLEKLKRAFDLDFPIENADNYLIYLIDEYKENLRTKKELSDKLENNDKYQNILSRITELEIKKDELIEKSEERKQQLDVEQETLDKMNESIVSIEDKAKEIKNLVDKGMEELEDIKLKVKETVHITERFETITKSVSHSIIELLLLMSLLKHHLSLKNNAVNAVAASVTLGLIMKMCTPVEEKVLVKESDLKDYENMITDCINDTGKLLNTINNNLNQISSIRYTFLNDYKELDRLPMYKEIMDKLNTLESDMKERLDSTKKLTRDMNIQLEKNNAKVKKYGNLEVA